jgi:hypothetical protein
VARACGSYPQCPGFKSLRRYHSKNNEIVGPVVKRLRHRPFTAVTGVRVPSGSPLMLTDFYGHFFISFLEKTGQNPWHKSQNESKRDLMSFDFLNLSPLLTFFMYRLIYNKTYQFLGVGGLFDLQQDKCFEGLFMGN